MLLSGVSHFIVSNLDDFITSDDVGQRTEILKHIDDDGLLAYE